MSKLINFFVILENVVKNQEVPKDKVFYEKLEMQFSRHPTIKETVARDFCFELSLWGLG